jgi:hypothetical protein
MTNKKIERLFYKSLDSTLSRKEEEILNTELQHSEKLREKYSQIITMRNAVSKSAITSFQPSFEENLFRKIYNPEKEKKSLNGWSNFLFISFRRIAFTAIIILIILISYNLNSGNKYSIENLLGIYETSLEHAFDPFRNLLWSEKQ